MDCQAYNVGLWWMWKNGNESETVQRIYATSLDDAQDITKRAIASGTIWRERANGAPLIRWVAIAPYQHGALLGEKPHDNFCAINTRTSAVPNCDCGKEAAAIREAATTPNTPTPRAVEAMMCENCGCADDTVRAIPEVSRLAPGCRQYLCHRTESDCVAALKHQLTALRAGIEFQVAMFDKMQRLAPVNHGGELGAAPHPHGGYFARWEVCDRQNALRALLSGPEVGA